MADEPEVETEVFNHAEHFMATLVALKNGAVLADVGERLSSLVQAVSETERSGSLTVVFKVVPIGGNSEAVTVEADVKEKIPKPSLGKTTFFTLPDGVLTRNNPKQLDLGLKREQ